MHVNNARNTTAIISKCRLYKHLTLSNGTDDLALFVHTPKDGISGLTLILPQLVFRR